MERIDTNLNSRIEERYVIRNPKKYFSALKQQDFKEEKYSNKTVALTIYFNVPNCPLPFNSSIKARKYLTTKLSSVILNKNDEFFFEVKTTGETISQKEKIRYRASITEIVAYSKQTFHPDIQPVLAIQYERTHYVQKNGNGEIRVTFDSPVDFFLFQEKKLQADYIGSETNCTRLEVKAKNKELINNFLPTDRDRYPVISKGLSGFNFMQKTQEVKYGKNDFIKELRGIEIEAKLETVENDQVLNAIKKIFDSGVKNFKTDLTFPFVVNSASINRYLQDKVHANLRAALCDSRVKVTDKNEGEFIKNPHGLSCILRRNENKGVWRLLWDTPEMRYPAIGEFLRIRRAFWPVNQETGRFYHISYDICHETNESTLRQIEIEYVGKIGDKDFKQFSQSERLIIDDVGLITNIILEKFKTIKQSEVRKSDFFSHD